MRSRLVRALALAAALSSGRAGVARADVPFERQAVIMLRILAYDHSLPSRAGGTVRLAVVHADGPAARTCAGQMRSVLDDLASRVVVIGKPIEVETVPVDDATAELVARRRFSVFYVCRGSDAEVPAVARAARSANVLTFSDQVSYLALGLAIALSEDGARVGISINLVAARAQGARLAGQLLQLSKVVSR